LAVQAERAGPVARVELENLAVLAAQAEPAGLVAQAELAGLVARAGSEGPVGLVQTLAQVAEADPAACQPIEVAVTPLVDEARRGAAGAVLSAAVAEWADDRRGQLAAEVAAAWEEVAAAEAADAAAAVAGDNNP
jgi:hypothetical protein